MAEDVRWVQRLENYRKACDRLEAAVTLARSRELSELEEQGLIQAFEFTHELAWKVIKDWFEDHGSTGITGSKDATREAFSRGLISEGELWMEMVRSRNLSSHTYNLETARELSGRIVAAYAAELLSFRDNMLQRAIR